MTGRPPRPSARPTHDPRALARFQNGERRLVYARYVDRPNDPPFFLPDSEADKYRQFTKDQLECLMPDCADRRLRTVARTGRRDGFRHFRGAGGHSREGLFHQQGKALFARWVHERWPEVKAVVEQATASRERRADVMLTYPDARQVAVEIQYAPLTVEEWRHRHNSYEEQGIADVWLFGHLPPHLRAARSPYGEAEQRTSMIELGVLHQEMSSAGVDPLWINPIDQTIGTAWVDRPVHFCLGRRCGHPGADRSVYPTGSLCGFARAFFAVDELADCILTPGGLITPTAVSLAESDAAFDRAVDAELRRQEQEVAEREYVAAMARARREAERAVWMSSPLRQKLIRRFGAVPPVLSAQLPHDGGVLADPECWHAALYWELVFDRPVGYTFTIADCYRQLGRYSIELSNRNATERGMAVVRFLEYLERQGLVEVFHLHGSWMVGQVRVRDDLDLAGKTPTERAREAAHQRAAQPSAPAKKQPTEQGQAVQAELEERRAGHESRIGYLKQRSARRASEPKAASSGDLLPRQLPRGHGPIGWGNGWGPFRR